jgi:hypothetical protein
MAVFAEALWDTWLELAPWFLLGVAAAVVLHRALPRDFAERRLRGAAAVPTSVLLGVPLPLCSCGVLPTALGLRRAGASRGASVGFLISTPQTGVDSILVSASFLGLPFALFKVASAAIMGLAGGWLADASGGPEPAADGVADRSAGRPTWRQSLEHGLEILEMVLPWVVFGVVVSAALTAFVPDSVWAGLRDLGVFGGMLIALALSLPLYVCATGSVPIAAALVAGGLPAGAALVFLMAGPATNAGTIGALTRQFGVRTTVVYVGTIVAGSLGLGWAFSLIWAPEVTVGAQHAHQAWWAVASGVVLLGFLGKYGFERGRSAWSRWRMRGDAPAFELPVQGMTCGGCERKVENALLAQPGVEGATAEREPGRAIVRGRASREAVVRAIEAAGFRVGSPPDDPQPA